MGEGFDVFSTHELIPQIKDTLKITEAESREIALTLCMSKTKSFLDEEKLSLLKITLLDDPSKALHEHHEKYFWLADNYKWKADLDIEYFKKELNDIKENTEIEKRIASIENYEEEIRQKKESIIKKYNTPDTLLEILKELEHLSYWIDVRKIMQLKFFHIIFTILEEIENRFSLEKNSTKYLLPKEVIEILKNNSRFDHKTRVQGYLYYLDSDFKEIFVDGKIANDLIDAYLNKGTSDEIKGVTASVGKGNIKAKIKIIRDVTTDKFNPGNILVASMTRPEFVPLMRKAAGIITDEGGITCHAAIVSRELGIPCIIGTKNATRLLKDEEEVELDVENGTIRRLK